MCGHGHRIVLIPFKRDLSLELFLYLTTVQEWLRPLIGRHVFLQSCTKHLTFFCFFYIDPPQNSYRQLTNYNKPVLLFSSAKYDIENSKQLSQFPEPFLYLTSAVTNVQEWLRSQNRFMVLRSILLLT